MLLPNATQNKYGAIRMVNPKDRVEAVQVKKRPAVGGPRVSGTDVEGSHKKEEPRQRYSQVPQRYIQGFTCLWSYSGVCADNHPPLFFGVVSDLPARPT